MTSANPTGNPIENIAQPQNTEDEMNETTIILQSTTTPPSASATGSPNMASEERTKRPKDKHANEPISTFNQHLTTAAHASILLFVILIIYFCISGNFEFFTWHPLLLSIGWMFLMTEAILFLSKDNLFTGTLPKKVRVKLHWIFLTIGIVLVLSGFAVVFINKNNKNKEHFKTWHALFGLLGIACSVPTALNGILALYHGDLRNYISPRINKFVHFASGLATYLFGGLALILSVYTNWFAKNSEKSIITFVLGLVLTSYPIIWTLTKPTMACLKLLKKFMKTE